MKIKEAVNEIQQGQGIYYRDMEAGWYLLASLHEGTKELKLECDLRVFVNIGNE